ncbi:MAG: type II toxin-antitoxin system HicA family toxin [Gemmatimonadota bacterium]
MQALGKAGYEVDRQKGSHIVLRQRQAPHRPTATEPYEANEQPTLDRAPSANPSHPAIDRFGAAR